MHDGSWVPHRPERPEKGEGGIPLKLVSEFEPKGDQSNAIKELVDRMHNAGWVDDSLSFLQSVLVREDLESTVVTEGIAFPHARSHAVKRLGAAFGVHARRHGRQGIIIEINGGGIDDDGTA